MQQQSSAFPHLPVGILYFVRTAARNLTKTSIVYRLNGILRMPYTTSLHIIACGDGFSAKDPSSPTSRLKTDGANTDSTINIVTKKAIIRFVLLEDLPRLAASAKAVNLIRAKSWAMRTCGQHHALQIEGWKGPNRKQEKSPSFHLPFSGSSCPLCTTVRISSPFLTPPSGFYVKMIEDILLETGMIRSRLSSPETYYCYRKDLLLKTSIEYITCQRKYEEAGCTRGEMRPKKGHMPQFQASNLQEALGVLWSGLGWYCKLSLGLEGPNRTPWYTPKPSASGVRTASKA